MDAGRPPRIMKRSAGLVGGARVDRRPAEAACERLGCYVKVGAQSGGSRLGTGESFQRRVPGGCVVRAGSGGPRRRRRTPRRSGHEGTVSLDEGNLPTGESAGAWAWRAVLRVCSCSVDAGGNSRPVDMTDRGNMESRLLHNSPKSKQTTFFGHGAHACEA